MACASCGKRLVSIGGNRPAVGAQSRTVFYAVGPGPDPEVVRGPTLYAARARARKGGKGWEIAGRREAIDEGVE